MRSLNWTKLVEPERVQVAGHPKGVTTTRKGGRPRLRHLAMVEEVIRRRAEGETIYQIEAAGVTSNSTASVIAREENDRIDMMRKALQEKSLGKVLGRSGAWLRARMKNWCDPQSRTVGAEMRSIFEMCGLIGRGNVHIGDVNVSNVTVDRSQHVHAGYDPALEQELRAKLGVANSQAMTQKLASEDAEPSI